VFGIAVSIFQPFSRWTEAVAGRVAMHVLLSTDNSAEPKSPPEQDILYESSLIALVTGNPMMIDLMFASAREQKKKSEYSNVVSGKISSIGF
jgi:hypothetical protein